MSPQIAAQVAGAAVKTANGASISTGIWTLVGIVASGTLAALAAWMRFGPTWKKTEQDGANKLRDEMWKDIANLKLAKEDQSRRLTIAETTIAAQTIKLGQQAFVINLVLDELERVNPGNTIARQARMLLRMQANAMPHAEEIGPMAEIMSKLCKEPECDDGGKSA